MNVTNLTSISIFTELYSYANTLTDGVFWFVMNILIFVIAFFILKNEKIGLPASLFIGMIISLLLVSLELVIGYVFVGFAAALAVSVFYMLASES
jgi:hypothetical protein